MLTETDFQKATELINKSTNILITSHIKPDGDSCGCIVALQQWLAGLSKNVKPLLLSPVPEWYKFLFIENPAVLNEDITLQQLKQGILGSFELIIIVDTNSRTQLPEFETYLQDNDRSVLVIDHHITTDGLGAVELVDSTAAAAALIVYDFLKYVKCQITPKIAEALFVAVSTDTGWFQFNNTDSRVHRVCAELIDADLNPAAIYHKLYQNFSPARIKLMTRMFDNLQLHFNGRYAVQHLTQDDFRQTGASYEDTENLIDECRRIRTVEVAALFVELKDGKIKCSLRSRGTVNVSQIAQKLGGGGHKMASGVNLQPPLANAMKTIKDQIEKQLPLTSCEI